MKRNAARASGPSAFLFIVCVATRHLIDPRKLTCSLRLPAGGTPCFLLLNSGLSRQYKSGLSRIDQKRDLPSSDLDEYLKSIGVVEKIAKTRGMMLRQNMRTVPSDQDEMRSWKLVYVELLERLQKELPALAKGLE